MIAITIVLHFAYRTEPTYAGQDLTYWCDRLPRTVQIPLPTGEVGFGKENLTPTSKQALKAIDAMGTNALPALFSHFQRKHSRLQFELRKFEARFGLIKPTEIGTLQMRRERALTGILELGGQARGITPELLTLTRNTDSWLSASARYVLQQIAPGELESLADDKKVGK